VVSQVVLTNDEAYDLVLAIASGVLDTVEAIATLLRDATAPRAQFARGADP
jgi:hypothetical protein